MLSGRSLWDELITRPEESYRLWCVVVCDLETSRGGHDPRWVAASHTHTHKKDDHRIMKKVKKSNV